MIGLSVAKRLLARVLTVAPFCVQCGHRAEDFTVNDRVWALVGRAGPICFRCFDRATATAGLPRAWRVHVEREFWDTAWALRALPPSVVRMDPTGKIRLGAALGTLPEDYRTILRRDACAYCGERGGTVDHITPLSERGPDVVDNLTGCCERCNQAKSNIRLLPFLAMQHRVAMEIRRQRAAYARPKARNGALTATISDMVKGRKVQKGVPDSESAEGLSISA